MLRKYLHTLGYIEKCETYKSESLKRNLDKYE